MWSERQIFVSIWIPDFAGTIAGRLIEWGGGFKVRFGADDRSYPTLMRWFNPQAIQRVISRRG